MATGSAPRRDGPWRCRRCSTTRCGTLCHWQDHQPRAGTAPAAPVGSSTAATGTSVPRALFLDRRLTPLEGNAWQVFRLQLNDDGVTAFSHLRPAPPYLASMPCAAQASHETVARALTLLRLTRWLSLVRRRRDPKTGRILATSTCCTTNR